MLVQASDEAENEDEGQADAVADQVDAEHSADHKAGLVMSISLILQFRSFETSQLSLTVLLCSCFDLCSGSN